MRYTKRVSRISVVGRGWYGQTMATDYDLDDYALGNIVPHCWKEQPGRHVTPYDRDGVEQWLMLNSGDFKSVQDFSVTISDAAGNDFDSDWATEDGECAYGDCMFPAEDCDDAPEPERHVHDSGVCCECSGKHCCEDCPVFCDDDAVSR